MGDDALDDVGTLAKFAGALVEMFAAGRTAIEHLRRRDVVDRAAEVAGRVGVQIGERRKLLAGLMAVSYTHLWFAGTTGSGDGFGKPGDDDDGKFVGSDLGGGG